jgi:predicted RNA-binding Zn-ribbon protein involved in translation (DUF1610 family)
MQSEDVLAQYQSCEVCEVEMGEDGQEHLCGDCGEELTEDQCREWNGYCSSCAWLLKR